MDIPGFRPVGRHLLQRQPRTSGRTVYQCRNDCCDRDNSGRPVYRITVPFELREIEIAIKVDNTHYLHYTEARQFDREIEFEPPFLLYGPSPRVSWPAIGTPRPVNGNVSLLPPGQDRGTRASENVDFGGSSGNEYGIEVVLSNPNTGSIYSKETGSSKPGLARGHVFPFEADVTVPEGNEISYRMTAEGTTYAWTTKPMYEGGFYPILPAIDDTLSAEKTRGSTRSANPAFFPR